MVHTQDFQVVNDRFPALAVRQGVLTVCGSATKYAVLGLRQGSDLRLCLELSLR